MLLKIHLDASYILVTGNNIRTAGHLFLRWKPLKNRRINNNGAILFLCTIFKFMVPSVTKSKLGAILIN